MPLPHRSFELMTPDTAAECLPHINTGLYQALWACLDDQPPRDHYFDPEECGPADVIGLLPSVEDYWDRFTEDQQHQLNIAAQGEE